MSEILTIEQRDGFVRVVLGDSAHGNLVSNEEGDRLVQHLAGLDESVRLVRIESDGKTFCTGRVSPMPPPGSRVSGHHLKTVVAEPALRVYDGLRNLPVPVLSVVRGAAHGYGCALVAASDLAIAGETATFRVSEMERNIPPLLVLAAMLGRVPYKAMAHLALSCDEISALRARELGIVSEVVADDRLVEEADRLTNAIVGYDADAVRAIKEFLRTAPAASPHAVLAISANLTGTALARRFAGG